MIKLSDLMQHPDNPRTISSSEMELLKISVSEFSKAMELNPICYDEDKLIWSGNQRYEVLKELGYEEIPESWTKEMIGYTLEEKKRYAVIANGHNGRWDGNTLLSDYWLEEAKEYGDSNVQRIIEEMKDDRANEGGGDSTQKEITTVWMLNIECDGEGHTKELYEEMVDRGYKCKIIT